MTFVLYIIKSTICLVLFYLGYKALFSRETFFHFNRKVLLGGMIFSLLLPLIEIKTEAPALIQQPFIELERIMSEEAGVNQVADEASIVMLPGEVTATRIPVAHIAIGIYLVGISVTLSSLFLSFVGLWTLILKGRRIPTNNYVIVVTDNAPAPFNWWKYIVLSEQDYQNHPEEILTHELAHYHKRHSWDLLFAEAVILFHWFNPAAWLLKRELQEVHEYQADCEVLKQDIDATQYQLLLVKKAVGSSSYTFANSFNQSKLKKRITMMFKEQSNKWARWKLLLLLPVATVAVYAFAQPDVDRTLSQLIPEDTIISPEVSSSIPEIQESSEVQKKEQIFWATIPDGKPKYYPIEIFIIKEMSEGEEKCVVVINENDTMDAVRKKLIASKGEGKVEVVGFGFKAQKETPMGILTDISEVAREVYNESPLFKRYFLAP